VDEQGGKVFCLVEAQDAEPAASMHREATDWSPTISTRRRKAPRRRLLARQLGREDVDRLDHRRLRQQLGRLRHQSGRDKAPEVGLPARVVREGVEDAELRWAKADREPRDGCRFLLDQASPLSRKLVTSASLPGLASRRTSSPTVTIVGLPSTL
jgi:hypothetical protein